MGGDLTRRAAGKAPSFLVAALKDPIGANLDRIQIVKGWQDANGALQEKVYDVAWGDAQNRKPDADGKLPPVGNTVDVANATWTNTIGDPELITVWTDPDFDPPCARSTTSACSKFPRRAGRPTTPSTSASQMPKEVPMTTPGARLHVADLVHAQELSTRRCLDRLLREPLLHFLVLGGLIFLAFGRGGSGPTEAGAPIVITQADVERLARGFERTWHRPPDEVEIGAAVDDYVREEILYRAGLSMGLDKNDTIVRRRLRQKMEFLFEDTIPEPQETDLRAFYERRADKFHTEPLISFRQVFLSSGRQSLDADARDVVTRLTSGAKAEDEGDPLLLGEDFDNTSLSQVRAMFGDTFARKLMEVKPGQWAGPLTSGYGVHVVQITAMENARLPPYEEVKGAVRREWFSERRAMALNEQYQKLRSQVTVQFPHNLVLAR